MPLLTPQRLLITLAVYVAIFVVAVVWAPFVGSEPVNWQTVFTQASSIDAQIFFGQRLPRVLLAVLVGGSLAVVGACLQALFRNPLAEPYTLGITGGSAVGAVLAILYPAIQASWGPFSTVQVFSLLGAGAALGLIFQLARRPQGIAMNTLLLAGVTVSVLCGGMILMLRYLASPNYLVQLDRWLMGGLEVIGFREIAGLMPLLVPGLLLLFSCLVELNHLALGPDLAQGQGVDVRSVQYRIFFGSGLATAAVVSIAGPIGFVGLIIPHAVRRVSGFDHRLVLPGSFLIGAGFLVICDTAARTLLAPREIPVGVITAMVGGPMFIYLLVRRG